MEKTFLMLKPDAVQRKMIGKLVQRFEDKGFELIGAKLMRMTMAQAEAHYAEHTDKPFYGELLEFITSGPVFAMVWQGKGVVAMSRLMIGKTNPLEASAGTIRGDFATDKGNNIIHGSDSPESAEREITNAFQPEELLIFDPTEVKLEALHVNEYGAIQNNHPRF
ncbi:nucleoside-diphosphate kinase [Paenibacillus radicis (ex Xue et al. 2023)]|uniref:Nucleoside diphosphate kinase n=1 Tax=Paenibacillus radicis (ex Xue et al. 2023) TaxID=2972489 RepID=A0ABT1YLG9_9BACL|nr:nucleoside-diphosphate kinase [Paenibacillus radicis (ex Xue et al. 2023)]MCR8634031.1 nucleoside-diphosphate kinase [Paenibacillus radicis (ex Xue et al. 2023)]